MYIKFWYVFSIYDTSKVQDIVANIKQLLIIARKYEKDILILYEVRDKNNQPQNIIWYWPFPKILWYVHLFRNCKLTWNYQRTQKRSFLYFFLIFWWSLWRANPTTIFPLYFLFFIYIYIYIYCINGLGNDHWFLLIYMIMGYG